MPDPLFNIVDRMTHIPRLRSMRRCVLDFILPPIFRIRSARRRSLPMLQAEADYTSRRRGTAEFGRMSRPSQSAPIRPRGRPSDRPAKWVRWTRVRDDESSGPVPASGLW